MRWGIFGTGGIATALVHAIRAEGGEVLAVSSASAKRAEAFGAEHGIERTYGAHHDLLELREDLDAVYVATTNDRHHADALACIEAGVPTLVEKPFTLDRAQAEDVVAAARAWGVFVMEAMWMRFHPAFIELERRVADGAIGPPLVVQADLGIAANADPTRRWFALEQGGGALLDVGVYPLTFALSLLGPVEHVRALGVLADSGVDATVAITLRHRDGGLSSLVGSLVADTGIEAVVAGPGGSIRVGAPFHETARFERRRGSEVLDTHRAVEPAGYRPEVAEVHRCVSEGLTESPRLPLERTLELMGVLDEIRGQIGLRWPTR